jgi:hypothetical protein
MPERDLPLDDYDHLPVGSLISRIRTLDATGLQTLLDYEKGHANRIQIVSAMQTRLGSLKAGAQPSGGDPSAPTPEAAPPAESAPKVTGTNAPKMNPPSAGDPTNPAQPR